MEFEALVQKRRSVHNFQPDLKLSQIEFEAILEYVRYTPSGYNAQPWRFELIQDQKMLTEIHNIAFKQKHILDAGNLVVIWGDVEFGEKESERICQEWKEYRNFTEDQIKALKASLRKDRPESQKREMVIRNCSLAAMSFLYAATDLGYASCPMMGFSQKKLIDLLEPVSTEIPILLIALGKADMDRAEPSQLPRKQL